MTEKQLITKIRSMKKDINKYLEEEAVRIYRCGGIDPEAYNKDEFALPKIILHVALKNLADQYRPLHEPHKATANNLEHF
jgi:hypothetical protein